MSHWSVQDAKNHFSEVMTAARTSPQTVTKHGKPAVVVVDADAFDRLTGIKKKPLNPDGTEMTFVDHLLAMPQDGGAFERAPVEARDIDL